MANLDNLLICLGSIRGKEPVEIFIRRIQQESEENHDEILVSLRQYLDVLLRASDQVDQQPHTDELNSACNIDLIYLALVELAKILPRNDDDFSGAGVIPEEDLIHTGSGYVFNIHSLLHYHQVRDYRGSADNELPGEKFLLNPYTNERFHYKDVLHLLNFIRQKGLTIEGVRINDEGPAININPRIPGPPPSTPLQQAPDIRSLPRPVRPTVGRVMSPSVYRDSTIVRENSLVITRDNRLMNRPEFANISLAPFELKVILRIRREEARRALQNAELSLRSLDSQVYSLR